MQATVRDRLLKHAPCRMTADVILAPYTSFMIGGPAALFAEPSTITELRELLKLIRSEAIDAFYLGLGSNLLISDAGYDGIVIRSGGDLGQVTIKGNILESGPATKLLKLTTFAAYHEFSGLEPLSGIPGSVGGALWMNAGAYGGEICDRLLDVDVITPHDELITVQASEIGFGYRSAPLLEDKVVLHSRYQLTPGDKAAVYSEMRRVWQLRRAKQPLEYPSAGSVFKRPPGDYAGRLIEAVDGKGLRVGGAMVPHKHAGIFINYDHATADDVVRLIREIRQRVFDKFGILLENEVKPVGFKNDPFAIAS